ncbi:ATP-dependent helicase [Desulfofundulus thermosubterraneus]|uniref:DNA 3'-5' helicase n=1 Tax=Desulfofundulus thermosubterraneus DSM 16057 TaxID=1121432 RepID=A0A1M6JHG1_9FIRM|nr:ATP-dependent helicase [Desulfofundulus thermosubterraneus]SHJ46147.1 DNA helicase-2 / ATP-dependent DNA helicase PcrA [Desulfofundulus thermosubterraneus DSM 16057]
MLLENLNETQRAAALHGEGPCLVLAGPGSGKTRVLTYRAARLLNEGKCAPENLLLVTFTKKAAEEMKERLHALVGDAANIAFVGTFHSFCYSVLRDLNPRLDVVEGYKKKKLFREALAATGLSDLLDLAEVMRKVGLLKNELVTWEDYSENLRREKEKSETELALARVYRKYEELKAAENLVDFDDMLLMAYRAFSEEENLLRYWRNRLRFVMVDEYQDTNRAQFEILKLLVPPPDGNLFVVGDEDQSVYKFRGAHPEYTLDFEKTYPSAEVFALDVNYRSTANIVSLVNAVIEKNRFRRADKPAVRPVNGAGPDVVFVRAKDEIAEAEEAVSEIEKLKADGIPLGEIAVLYRTNVQARPFEEELVAKGIPCVVYGSCGFWDRKEVRDILAYLQLVHDPDSAAGDEAVERVINVPTRYLGRKFLDAARLHASNRKISLYRAVPEVGFGNRKQQKAAREFFELIEGLRRRKLPPAALIRAVIGETGYEDYLRREEGLTEDADSDRLEHLEELKRAASRFDNVGEFLAHAENVRKAVLSKNENGADLDAVRLMTLHRAKGLEFRAVFVVGVTQGKLPHHRSDDEEEERRLFFVGLSRAKEYLYVSHFGKPSEFWEEAVKAVRGGDSTVRSLD